MAPSSDLLYPFLSIALLCIGFICLLTPRRVVKQVVGLSIMLQGALVSIVGAGQVNGKMQETQSMVISALVAEAIVLAISLAVTVNVFRFHPEGRVDDLDTLKG